MKLTMTEKRALKIVGDLLHYSLHGEFQSYLKSLSLAEMIEANEVVKRIKRKRTVQWVDGKKCMGWTCFVHLSDSAVADAYSGIHGQVSLDDIQTFTKNASDVLEEHDEKPIRFVTDGDYCWFENENQQDFTEYGSLKNAIDQVKEKVDFLEDQAGAV